MALSADALKLEIGSEAYNDLTSDEVTSICSTYDSDEVRLAGMKAFELLSKKFKPSYRMGRMYENLGDRYEHYDRIFCRYASSVNAGYAPDVDETGKYQLDRTRFIETDDGDSDAD